VKFSKEGDLLFASGKDKLVTGKKNKKIKFQVWYTKDGQLLGSYLNKGAVNSLDVNGKSLIL
jgi:hypothetical protein